MPSNATTPSLLRTLAAIFYDLIIVFFGLFMVVGFAILPLYKGLTGHESIKQAIYFFHSFWPQLPFYTMPFLGELAARPLA